MTDDALAVFRRLGAQWRENADKANELVRKFEMEHDESGNAFAFLKERRIWNTCADELDAAVAGLSAHTLDTVTRYQPFLLDDRYEGMMPIDSGDWVKRSDVMAAGLLASPQETTMPDDLTRVAPLKAGADGQDLPQSGNGVEVT